MVKKITYPLKKKEEKNWAVYYDNDGYTIQDEKIMGRQAAGWSYLKALVHSKPSKLGVYLKARKNFWSLFLFLKVFFLLFPGYVLNFF